MFNFGKNWQEYSLQVLDETRLAAAQESLDVLLDDMLLADKRILDVGCGSGIFSIAVVQRGGYVTGIDVNPLCIKVSSENARAYLPQTSPIQFEICNALDPNAMQSLGEFDLVYAWGSLHHTGDMYRAIQLTAERVKPGGVLVLAIYNSHITSPMWKVLKWLYNHVPVILQRMLVLLFGMVIYLAKLVVTRQNPLNKTRGMDFWYDVVDWIGGYPYEHATAQKIRDYVEALGLQHRKTIPPTVPTGCNEFVFIKSPQ